jgi:hypothetical protein
MPRPPPESVGEAAPQTLMQTARQTVGRENTGESLHHSRQKWFGSATIRQLLPGSFQAIGCLKTGLALFPILQSDRLMVWPTNPLRQSRVCGLFARIPK